ncbi:radical SAM protein [Patescibacteria group bacterium]|nr:radical SAM protein [Patescibacteria group bacterium]MCG2701840.1 radical SAM protein [Candidatus Parcubacteria bacterium]MBU4265247.1 radical SAM protein [Patescibacteria group bacterium]MBU4390276.1 radical SAM protein [Patescibacteria group bacterium]MBU4431370.1 radical SAM protein [Patescibacteria group bacterium]
MSKKNVGLHILELELTNKCNLNCKHCYVDKKHTSELPCETVKDIISQAKELDVYRLVFTGGEPLIYSKIFNVATYAKKLGIKNLFLLTNGILVNKKNINKLKIFDGIQLSLDNIPNQKSSLRKDYSNVLENAVSLLQQNNININFYCTLCKSNTDKIDQIIKYANNLNVRIGFNTLIPLYPSLENQTLSPQETKESLTKIINYINKGFNVNLSHHLRFLVDKQKKADYESLIKENPNKIHGGCLAGIAALYISSDGSVLACPFIKYPCDNIFKNNLYNIWENNEILNVLRNRKNFEGKCGKCKYVNVCGGCRAHSLLKYGKINSSEFGCFL